MVTTVQLSDGFMLLGAAMNGMPFAIIQGKRKGSGGVYTPKDADFSRVLTNIMDWQKNGDIAIDDSKYRMVGGYGLLYVESGPEGAYFIVEENGKSRMVPVGHRDFDFFLKIFYENPMGYELGVLTPDSRETWTSHDWLAHFNFRRAMDQELEAVYVPQQNTNPQPMTGKDESGYGQPLPYATARGGPHPSDALDSVYTSLEKRRRLAEG